MTFRDYLRVAREWRLLVLVVTLVFGGAALAYSLKQTPVYEAEASLEFQDINTDISALGTRVDNGGQTPDARAAAAASTLIRPAVLQRAAQLLKRRNGLGGSVTARPEARTNLVIVQASAVSGIEAARVADAVARAAIQVTEDQVRGTFRQDATTQRRVLRRLRDRAKEDEAASFQVLQLQESIASLDELARVANPVVLRRNPVVPASPVSPKPVRTTLLGLLIGLTLGLLAAFVRDSLDGRFRTANELTDELHLPLVGYISEDVLGRSIAPGAEDDQTMSTEDLEGFRILRTNVEFLDVDNTPKVLLVTSALPEEGKSTVSAGIAAAYASAGKSTLLVETDLRRPTLAARTGLERAPGLTDYLVGHAEPKDVLQPIAPLLAPANGDRPPGAASSVPVVAITAGTQTPQTAELLRSRRCKEFFEEVRDAYDVIVIDTCPLLSVADTLELLPFADAFIVCVRASKTTRDQAKAAKAALSRFGDRPTGIVLTGVRATDDASYRGYYTYGYVYGA